MPLPAALAPPPLCPPPLCPPPTAATCAGEVPARPRRARAARWALVAGLAAAALAGCAAHTRVAGVVDASGAAPRLIEPSGQAWRLVPSAPDDAWLGALGGCTVHVEAMALGRRLRVGRWLVTDAGDGSQPYLGVLERTGHQLRLRDRQSGAVLLLEAPLDGPLAALDGQPVLVAGFLVGPNRLQVVSHRPLAPR